jgi:hypothetical protein
MNNENNPKKVHNDVLNEINEQIERISAIEAESDTSTVKPVPKWRKFINKILCKNPK